VKLEVQFNQLDTVRTAIGGELKTHSFQTKGLAAFKSIETELLSGIEITLNDVDGSRGVFTHQGRQIVIYIKDHTTRSDVVRSPSTGNKVHFRDCRTIEKMKRDKRYERYVATNRRDGIFLVDFDVYSGGADQETRLNPCQNCLNELNYYNFKNLNHSQKSDIVQNFDYDEFLENYSVFFENRPNNSDKTAFKSNYIEGWSYLSNRVRDRNNWLCMDCEIDCSAPNTRKFLHVHHVNGVKSDNSPQNLEVVCLLCHANKPHHSHMKISQDARNIINNLRHLVSLKN